MNELLMFFDLVSKSILKIVLILGGMLMVFLAFPISRTSRLFAAGLVGSFAGGVFIQLASDQYNLLLTTACSIAIAWGISMLPLLNVLGRLNQRLSEDDSLIDDLYQWLKSSVREKVSPITTKNKVDIVE